jgi:hypothetical protein
LCSRFHGPSRKAFTAIILSCASSRNNVNGFPTMRYVYR